jgi:O-antigen/teichoic acid export membrane protein
MDSSVRPHGLLNIVWSAVQLFSSRMLGQIAGFVVAILVARELGPDAFGMYAYLLVAATFVSSIPGAGLDLTAIRLCARDVVARPAYARGTLLLTSLLKLGCTMLLSGLVLLLVHPITTWLARSELLIPTYYAGVSAVVLALTETSLAALQAREHFGLLFGLNILAAGLKVVPVVVLLLIGQLTLDNAMLAFVLASLAVGLISAIVALYSWHGAFSWHHSMLAEILTFGRWSVTTTVLGVVSGNLDILALTSLAGVTDTGVYSAARTLALPVAVAAGALGMVLLPRFSRLAHSSEILQAVQRLNRLVILAAIGLTVLSYIVATLVVPMVYGTNYQEAITVFPVLVLAYSIQLVVWPGLAALMALDRPDVITWMSVAVVVTVAGGYLLVIPIYGANGAAWILAIMYALTIIPYRVLLARSGAGRLPSPRVSEGLR